MKQYLIMVITLLISVPLQAQSRRYFCEVKGVEKELSSGLKIVFDFGSNPVYSVTGLKGSQKLVDEQGEEIPFNSMVDAANYIVERGWCFQQAYTSVYGGNAIHHWIFYKEAESKDEAGKGIFTKERYERLKRESDK